MILQIVAGRLRWIAGRKLICAGFAVAIALGALHSTSLGASETSSSCEARIETREIGKFSVDPIDEASGLALAPDGEHFFVTNDSGDLPRFFRTKLDGSSIEDFRIHEIVAGAQKSWKPFDAEELNVGSCPKELGGDCLVIADIGDNRDRRKFVELVFIRLSDIPAPLSVTTKNSKPISVPVSKKLRLVYPDGPRNAEAFAVLNSRFGVIVSKQQDRKSRATRPAGVYVVDFETAKIAHVAELDVPAWVKDQGLAALVTGLSVAERTSRSVRMVLLTYRDAIELSFETNIMSSVTWPPRPWSVKARSVFKIDPLEQQEAITFDKKGTGFYYTTEQPLTILGFKSASIRWAEKMTCR
ncbi:hypothetical protein BH10BDE1_BH10BDE1_19840 [soil metagenome]